MVGSEFFEKLSPPGAFFCLKYENYSLPSTSAIIIYYLFCLLKNNFTQEGIPNDYFNDSAG